jgi:hypothetical protein
VLAVVQGAIAVRGGMMILKMMHVLSHFTHGDTHLGELTPTSYETISKCRSIIK